MTTLSIHPAYTIGAKLTDLLFHRVEIEDSPKLSRDVQISATPVFEGYGFVGGSEFAEFALAVRMAIEPRESGEDIAITIGRAELFVEGFICPNHIEGALLQGRDVTAQTLSEEKFALVYRFRREEIPMISELLYSLFVNYGFSLQDLRENDE